MNLARPASEPTEQGEQMLVAGVAPISARERLALRLVAPLSPRAPQKPCDLGLLDGEADEQTLQRSVCPPNARNQLSLF